ncbi:MAG: signal recognition particle-docking protein FtsY [Nanoarchaeota archaeon]
MFKFLKEKLKGWFKTAEEKAEEDENLAKAAEKQVKKKETKQKPVNKIEKSKKAGQDLRKTSQENLGLSGKPIKKPKDKREIEKERKISKEVLEDIKKERRTEHIKTMPSPEEILSGIEVEKEVVEEEKEEEEEIIEEKPKKGLFSRIFSRKYTISEEEFSEMFENLELILLENNVALEVADNLRDSLKKQLVDKEIDRNQLDKEIKSALKNSIEQLFVPGFNIEDKIKEKSPYVIAFFGINGSGKTTTISKLAYKLKNKGFSVILAAADTFRAASIEQLKQHGDKLGIKVISKDYGSDPASVAFDAVEYAKSHKIQVVLIDTAGRMHTKENLIKEMGKIVRVSKPDLKLFIGEAITGNDATEQAKTFNEAISIDGIILSKQDVDEKGGTSLSVSYITKKPILYLGMGQALGDLKEFNREDVIKALGL